MSGLARGLLAAATRRAPATCRTIPPVASSWRQRPHVRWCASASTEQVRLMDNAVQKLKSLQEQQQKSTLRLMVNSGGCSGYSYEFSLVSDDDSRKGDVVIEAGGAKLIVDELSLTFLEDCEIDYVQEMIRSSFQVTKNKLADASCGCGASFAVSF
eukprot:TRINITY_DN26106_c0_g2_i1.p1 TRINITY_DN26106_c0_g2~~TRINITY_DN26106_c0_g2_i1.p1  ORF type:complete len:156 (+),score=48.11 TRINITY_DN26106_c0_g2_i1:61-528(+)